ncbi:MAG: hypothetical protein LBG52_03470 [Candidatus Peribacteria bacterium]|nr:hypothetical protein [Candidatus Peribacteria bacterium]
MSQYSLSDGTLLRETPQGSIALRLPKHTLTNQHFTTTQPHYQVQQTFSNGSTNNKSTRGIFNTQNQLDLPAGYLSIQDSTTSSNYVGFRGEFKNMTLFAQGERVGEASKKF